MRPSIDRIVYAYLTANPEQRETVTQSLQTLLGLLRAQAFSYQTSHWQVAGNAGYGNHLLFERLYSSVLKQIDGLAEKMVGYLKPGIVAPIPAAEVMKAWVNKWATDQPCPFCRAEESERDCQTVIQQVYDAIKASGTMTLGLDDWLMATANAHEENAYLLQQSHVPHDKTAAEAMAPSAEQLFHDNPEKREVREFANSGAISNNPEIAADAATQDNMDESPAAAAMEAEIAPPTPAEIEEEPGGDQLSTLNRFIVQTDEPVPSSVPQSHDEVEKHPVLTAALSRYLRELKTP